jgi:hypothetical protein
MSNYTKTTNFAAKDSLNSGDANKVIKGAEIGAEFDNIVTSIATKADLASPAITGTATVTNVVLSGTMSGGSIEGGTY